MLFLFTYINVNVVIFCIFTLLPFAEDLLAALALCHRLLSPADMARGAESFTGLPHRVRRVARGGGISFFDSSIDTSPSRTAATLSLFCEKEGE
ncbi:MAG: hypothetical protein J6S44_05490 [Clostridia bacterium]|nr:hypothetical protein [Clostridia bacterium]